MDIKSRDALTEHPLLLVSVTVMNSSHNDVNKRMRGEYYIFVALPMECVNNQDKPRNKLVVVSSSLQRITMQFAFSVSFIRL
jgi:hypothetical protein